MNCTYLVTGGAGFIGSHLCDALVAGGNRVIALDDFSTGEVDNLKQLAGRPEFELVTGSVTDRDLLPGLVARADRIFHLAAVVGVARVVESPVRTIETNIRGTDLLLEWADREHKPVLLASTSEVYGKSTALPFDEEADLVFGPTDRGRWSYACSKALDEYLALAYHHERQLPVVIARLFNTVGPRQSAKYGMVLPRFVQRALAGAPITIYGDGTHTRCFCHVSDVVWALQRLALAEGTTGKVFNLGTQERISMLDLANLVKERLGSASEIEFVSYQSAFGARFEESVDRVPDLRRIREAIGYDPKVTLVDIIDGIAEHFRAKG